MRAFLFVGLFVLAIALLVLPVTAAAGTGALVGRVVSDGAGVAGVYVQAWDRGASVAYRVTDAGGAFAFDALPCAKSYMLKVWQSGTPVMWYSVGVLGCGATYDTGDIMYPPVAPTPEHVTPPPPPDTPTPEPTPPAPLPTATPRSMAEVRGTVWSDLNSNGVVDGDEPRYFNMRVAALSEGVSRSATTTNSAGGYSLGIPSCGVYSVAVMDARGVSHVSGPLSLCAIRVTLDLDMQAGRFYVR